MQHGMCAYLTNSSHGNSQFLDRDGQEDPWTCSC